MGQVRKMKVGCKAYIHNDPEPWRIEKAWWDEWHEKRLALSRNGKVRMAFACDCSSIPFGNKYSDEVVAMASSVGLSLRETERTLRGK